MKKNSPFTLIELLAVLGIFSLLAALLFPVLGSVRGRGRTAVCLNSIRQVAVMHLLYTDLSGGVFCPAWDTSFHQWDASGNYRSEGTLAKTVGLPDAIRGETFECPEARFQLSRSAARAPRFAGYGYNYLLSFESADASPPDFRRVKITQVRRPASTVLLADSACLLYSGGKPAPSPSSFLYDPVSGKGGYTDFRHSGGRAVVACVDGHVFQPREILRAGQGVPAEYRDRLGYPPESDVKFNPF